MKVLSYLRDQLNGQGDFLAQFKGLSSDDKLQLKEYGRQECKVLGIALENG